MKDSNEVIEYYSKLLKNNTDNDILAVDWQSLWAQEYLFYDAIEGLDEERLKSGASILDIGCGLGAFYQFLINQGYNIDYTGYDITPGMIESAKERYPNAKFEVRDILKNPPEPQQFDFVFSSGALTMLIPDHERWLHRMIHRMFDACRYSLSFNLLSKNALALHRECQIDNQRYYASPDKILNFSFSLTPNCSLKNNSASLSFTMQLNRAGNARSQAASKYEAKLNAAHNSKDSYIKTKYLIDNQRFKEAALYLDNIKKDSKLWHYDAICHSKLMETEAAKNSLKQALKLNPKCHLANTEMGFLYFTQKNYEKSNVYFERIIDFSKCTSLNTAMNIVFCLVNQKKYLLAEKIIEKCGNKIIRNFIHGEFLYLQEKFNEAKKYFTNVVKNSQLSDAHLRLADIERRNNDEKKYLSHLKKILAISPNNIHVKYMLAQYYMDKNYKKVIKLLKNSVSNDALNLLYKKAVKQKTIEKNSDLSIIENSSLAIKSSDEIIILLYEIGETPLPIIIAKGRKDYINKVSPTLEQHKIPIIKSNNLAKHLYNNSQCDNYIPEDTVTPVAHLFQNLAANC